MGSSVKLLLLVLVLLLLSLVASKRARSGARPGRGTGKGKGKGKRGGKGEGRGELDADEPVGEVDAFDVVAQYLHKTGGKALKGYRYVEVRRALAKLASAQSALKTMDGATHHFVNAFKEASTLGARHERFVGSESPKRKEAAKLYEYVTTVERSLQAAEICQAARNTDDAERAQWFVDAGLKEVRRVTVEEDGLACVVSVLRPLPTATTNDTSTSAGSGSRGGDRERERKRRTAPQAYSPGEVVLAVVEAAGDVNACVGNALRVLRGEAETVPLRAVGFVSEDASVQPTLLRLAARVLEACRDLLVGPEPGAGAGVGAGVGVGLGGGKAEAGGGAGAEGAGVAATNTAEGVATPLASQSPPPPQQPQPLPLPTSLRVVGYSAGAAVGAYAAMIMDGSLASSHPLLQPTAAFSGAMHKRVQCLCLAPPPCLSRSLVPKFVSSVLCGDDIVPRASPDSLARLRERVLGALKAGAGKGGLAAYGLGGLVSWAGDVSSVAGRSLQQYTAGQHDGDTSALAVPGRVFYCKSRSLQNGASIQRVMRGNWREDVLWLLHDVLLSKKMADHHSLDYYIRCLSRL